MPKKPKPIPITIKSRSIGKAIIYYGGIAGGLTAMVVLWHTFGLPSVAWSSDIQRLDRQQTDTAIEIYQRAVRGQLSAPAPAESASKQLWEEELRENRRKLDEATKRRIELGK